VSRTGDENFGHVLVLVFVIASIWTLFAPASSSVLTTIHGRGTRSVEIVNEENILACDDACIGFNAPSSSFVRCS
jgi:hypothetical protein